MSVNTIFSARTFYPEICLKFSTCDLYCRCEKKGALPDAFKLKVVEYAEKYGNRCGERVFDVCEKLIRDWRKKKAELQSLPGSCR